jgi:hypothetical protein
MTQQTSLFGNTNPQQPTSLFSSNQNVQPNSLFGNPNDLQQIQMQPGYDLLMKILGQLSLNGTLNE